MLQSFWTFTLASSDASAVGVLCSPLASCRGGCSQDPSEVTTYIWEDKAGQRKILGLGQCQRKQGNFTSGAQWSVTAEHSRYAPS